MNAPLIAASRPTRLAVAESPSLTRNPASAIGHFAPDELDEALDYLGATDDLRSAVIAAVVELFAELGITVEAAR